MFCYRHLRPGVEGCPPGTRSAARRYAHATVPPAPFLQNPTTCGVPLTVTGEIEYYGGDVGKEDVPWPETTELQPGQLQPRA